VRKFFKKRYIALLIVIGFLVFAYDFLELRYDDGQFIEYLEENNFDYKPQVGYINRDKRRIRYVEIGNDSLPLLVFIHGAPSSSAFWRSYLKDSTLLSNAKLLAVDRPGYGYSNFGKSLTSVKKQAELLSEVIELKSKAHNKIILLGSSYGGTVAARIGMDFPDLVDGIIFQSSSLAPGEETTYWVTYPTSRWPLKWLIPTTFKVANEEKLSHRNELEKMEPFWSRIDAKCVILHGDQDELVYPSNAMYAKSNLINASIINLKLITGRGHDLTWTERNLIIDSILSLLDAIKKGDDNNYITRSQQDTRAQTLLP